MTFPITPDPSLHNDPTAKIDAQAQLKQAVAALQKLIAGIPAQIIQLLLSEPEVIINIVQKLIDAEVTAIDHEITDLWSQLQTIIGLILQVIQGLETTPLLEPLDLAGAIWFWFAGLFNTTLQGVSGQNPPFASLLNRVTALEGTTYTTSPRVDNFNDPTLANWAQIGSIPKIQAPNGLVVPSTVFEAGSFTASTPATGHYRVQAESKNLTFGRSRIIAQADSGFTNFVMVEVDMQSDNTVFSLGTASTLNGNITVHDSHTVSTGAFKENDVIGIEPNESNHEFKVVRNNQVVATWVDNAGTIGTGSSHRGMALCTNIDSSSTIPGCGWGVFSQADIKY